MRWTEVGLLEENHGWTAPGHPCSSHVADGHSRSGVPPQGSCGWPSVAAVAAHHPNSLSRLGTTQASVQVHLPRRKKHRFHKVVVTEPELGRDIWDVFIPIYPLIYHNVIITKSVEGHSHCCHSQVSMKLAVFPQKEHRNGNATIFKHSV